jgi:hypothetical protein
VDEVAKLRSNKALRRLPVLDHLAVERNRDSVLAAISAAPPDVRQLLKRDVSAPVRIESEFGQDPWPKQPHERPYPDVEASRATFSSWLR